MTETLTRQTPLERRYRRLLACYPTAYRTEYGEEMIGVLLASTPADQDRPTKAAAFDLIGGGLRAWFRLLRTGDGDSPWRNTLAVFSVIAPVLLFVTVTGTLVVSVIWANTHPFLYDRTSYNRFDELAIVSTIALVAAVICPLLARRGGIATRAATTIGVVAVASVVAVILGMLVDYGPYSWLDYLTSMLVIDDSRCALLARTGTRLALAWPQGPGAPDRHRGRTSGLGRAPRRLDAGPPSLRPVRSVEPRQFDRRHRARSRRDIDRHHAKVAGLRPLARCVRDPRLPAQRI